MAENDSKTSEWHNVKPNEVWELLICESISVKSIDFDHISSVHNSY